MNDNIKFEKLVPSLYDVYIRLGTVAYNQHYRHLWPNGDTSPYIENSFTDKVLIREAKDDNTALFLIRYNEDYAGILKITFDKSIDLYTPKESLYIDKIYIKKEYTGCGIGKNVIQFVLEKALKRKKKVIYLEAMQKGAALPFYLAHDFKIIGTTEIPFKNAIEEEKPMFVLLKKISVDDLF